MSKTPPVTPGGIIRVLCDTTDDQRVTADVPVLSVNQLKCGCWEVGTDRPGPDIPGPVSYRGMSVIFQVCQHKHDDGSEVDGTKVPPPVVVRPGPVTS